MSAMHPAIAVHLAALLGAVLVLGPAALIVWFTTPGAASGQKAAKPAGRFLATSDAKTGYIWVVDSTIGRTRRCSGSASLAIVCGEWEPN